MSHLFMHQREGSTQVAKYTHMQYRIYNGLHTTIRMLLVHSMRKKEMHASISKLPIHACVIVCISLYFICNNKIATCSCKMEKHMKTKTVAWYT